MGASSSRQSEGCVIKKAYPATPMALSAASAPIVFVVDDDESVRAALKRLLASAGLECETFANALEFLRRAEQGVTGCLLLDVRMPGVNGLELQQRLKAADVELPIIFVTGYADVPLTVRAMKAGALDLLTKPFEADVLLDAVQQALNRERAHRVEREELQQWRERFAMLTTREREVMGLVVTGMLTLML